MAGLGLEFCVREDSLVVPIGRGRRDVEKCVGRMVGWDGWFRVDMLVKDVFPSVRGYYMLPVFAFALGDWVLGRRHTCSVHYGDCLRWSECSEVESVVRRWVELLLKNEIGEAVHLRGVAWGISNLFQQGGIAQRTRSQQRRTIILQG